MKIYAALVAVHKKSLQKSKLIKFATDVAILLDNSLFSYPSGDEDGYSVRRMAKIREKLYDALCGILTHSSLPLPPLEPEFYQSQLKRQVQEMEQTEVRRITNYVLLEQMGEWTNSESKEICLAISLVMKAMPFCVGWSHLDKDTLVAKINQLLIENGRQPVRPDYSTWKPSVTSEFKKPSRAINIVIVDDEIDKIADTALALAGWNGVTAKIYYHDRNRKRDGKLGKDALMSIMADEIRALKPDVVIMDQGLDNEIYGNQLITFMVASSPELVFVANTGGDDRELRQAGAYPNCNKGEKLRYVVSAVESIGA
jgi:hypothetical protein